MSEIERLVQEQDRRWLGPNPEEARWRRDAKDMEVWPPEVPRRVFDPGRKWSMYELLARQKGR
jgi:hypothetical protein